MSDFYARLAHRIAFSILALTLASVVLSCKAKQADPDPWFVAAVSSGVLGRKEPVKVVFTQSQDTSKIPGSGAFILQPSAKGTLAWQDDHTLIFTPSETLKAGQRYQARVSISGIDPFTFNFVTAVPYMSVNLDPVQLDDSGDMVVKGTVSTDEDADTAKIETTVSSRDLGKPQWEHAA
ncbi:MAG: hypothetical protein FWF22_05050, partial [Treponema sp.]|nr:hypothetical protein [Treponema sp.]